MRANMGGSCVEMRNKRVPRIAILAITVAVIVGLTMVLYRMQVDAMLSATTLRNMQEIAQHDRAFVENTVDKSWTNLAQIGSRIRLGGYTNVAQVQRQLNIEQTASSFKAIYLVDEEGRLYSGAYLIRDGSKLGYVQDVLAGGAPTAKRYNDFDYRIDDQEEALMYAVPITPFEAGGVRFIGAIGQSDIRDLREHMMLSSFDGQGISYVVDQTGNYIVDQSNTDGIGRNTNLFGELADADFSGSFSCAKIRAEMQEGTEFSCTYRLEGSEYVLCLLPFENMDWYLAVSVPASVFLQQTGEFVLLTTAMVIAILLVVGLLLLGMVHSWKKSMQAQASAAAEEDFLNRMSHEIRTPLNALIGLNYLMRRSLNDTDRLDEYLAKSESTSQYLLQLINDILDISKLRQSSVALARDAFSLSRMTEHLCVMMKDRMEAKNIQFHVKSVLEAPIILGDEMRLKQVVLNILSNAIKFTPENGEITLELTQHFPVGDKSNVLTYISVRDTGVGMSKEFQKHIFEAFKQEKDSLPGDGGDASLRGTGLGMAISYLLMQQMNGRMEVESTPGKGSCFTVVLPAAVASAQQLIREEKAAESSSVPMKKLNILVAEDNHLNAEILVHILENEGHTAQVAQTGREALELFRDSPQNGFDLILMDAQMPEMDGCSAAQNIRHMERPDAASIPIYACTANTSEEDRARARQAGMNGFLAKPIDVKKLMEILRSIQKSGEEGA